MASEKIVVCGGGGFIGGHLVADLLRQGKKVRAVDQKPLQDWYQRFPDAENFQLTLQEKENCERAVADCSLVYNLAADMGGMGFIENNKALCMLSVLINTHLLMASKDANVERFLFSSFACVYAADKQTDPNVTALKEEDAYPAMAEDGYGWENYLANGFAGISAKISD
jgi:GDP-D-mannose 3', 5'-epimerase